MPIEQKEEKISIASTTSSNSTNCTYSANNEKVIGGKR